MAVADASDELERLRAELELARKHASSVEVRALEAEAAAARVMAINADLVARNAHLELLNARMRRGTYGMSSERSRRILDQLELAYEEAEADASEAELLAAKAAARMTTVEAFVRKRTSRRDFPAGLPREQVVIPAPGHCPCCGSDELSALPADITETLEQIPARQKVIQTVREKVACRACARISQPPAVLCYYSRDRKGVHPQAHLANWTGILQVDRYAGFNDMFKAGWPGKPITRANC